MNESAKARIISPWLLGLLALLLAAALYAMRPSPATMAQALSARAPSDLSVAYLTSLLRLSPQSPELLTLLAQQHVRLGHWEEARDVSTRLMARQDTTFRREGVRLYLLALEREAFDAPPDDPRRGLLTARLGQVLGTLAASETDPDTLKSMLGFIRVAHVPELAWQIYGSLAESDPGNAAAWHVLQGRQAQAEGWYGRAASAYFDAQAHSATRDESRRNFLAALDALRAGNQIDLACELAQQHLGALADDAVTLRYLVVLAREARRYDLMRRYGDALAKVLAAAPRYLDGPNGAWAMGRIQPPRLLRVASATSAGAADDQKDLGFLYRTFLESGALADAQGIAQRALTEPGVDRRLWLGRLGQVAEWNNQPAVALQAWDALAREFDDRAAWEDVLRLAPQLGDRMLWLGALKHSLQVDPGDTRRMGQLLAAYELTGDPQAALGALQGLPVMAAAQPASTEVAALQEIAESARRAGAGPVLLPIYGRLARLMPGQAAHWYAMQGEQALALGRYTDAAQSYFESQDSSETLEGRRTAFLAALGALRAGDQVVLACELAEQHLGDLARDPQTLRFLIGLAREAGRHDLMRAWGESLSRAIALAPRYLDGPRGAARLGWVADARVVRVATAAAPAAPSGVAADLDLLYRTFVESGALPEAVTTAQRALARTDVDRRLWLTRLAQAAEWDDQSGVALKAWHALAQKYDDDEAWRRLLELAPQMQADAIWLQALRHAALAAPGDFKRMVEVVAGYERVGDPDGGLRFLREHGNGSRQVLELQGALAERAGRDSLALATWQRLDRRYGPSPAYALHIASLLYAQGHVEPALAALQSARAAAEQHGAPADFWRTYVSLSRLAGDRAGQNSAVGTFLTQRSAARSDFNNMLYLYDGYPIDQGRVAEAAFRQTGDLAYLGEAITAYVQVRAWARVQGLLDALTAAQRHQLEQMPGVLMARAEFRQATGDPQGALRDLRRAYALPDASDEVAQSYLWAVLAFGDRAEARRLTREIAARHGSQPQYAAVLAAAMLQLDEPRRALAYMNMAGVPSREDPLWLVSYASVYEALGQPDLAWRIRRRAWQLLASRRNAADETLEARSALISLAQAYRAGDVSRAMLLSVLRDGPPDSYRLAASRSLLGDVQGVPTRAEIGSGPVPGAPAARHFDAALHALALAWAMDGEHYDLARVWLGNRYLAQMLRADNAQMVLALQDNDRARMAALLERDPATLGADDRVQALDRLGLVPQAQSEAFQAAQAAPDNDQRYETWLEAGLEQRPSAGLRTEYASVGSLETYSAFADAGWKLTDRLGLRLRHVERFNRTTDESDIAWVPRRDQETSLALIHADAGHRYELEAGWRKSLGSTFTGQLTAAWMSADTGTSLALVAGLNRYTDIDTLMSLGAGKDFLAAELSWDSQRDWFAGINLERARYRTQEGTHLGDGRGYTATLGYHLRTQGPAIDLSAFSSRWWFSSESGPVPEFAAFLPENEVPDAGAVMPQDTEQYGLTLNLGTERTEEYQRGWRPYLALSWLHDRRQGWGPGVEAGVGGRLLGRDRLGLYVTHEPARAGDSQRSTRAGLYYRLFY